MKIRLGSKTFRIDSIKRVEKISPHLALLRFVTGNSIQVLCLKDDVEGSVCYKGTPEELKEFIEKFNEK